MARFAAGLLSLAVAANVATAQTGQATDQSVEALIGDSVSSPSDERYNNVREAIQRFANGDQLAAETLLERAVEENPRLPPVGVLMAKLQLISGNAAAVRGALERAVQNDAADDPEPYLLLAEEALSGQRTIEADALFDKAVELIEAYDANAKRKRLFQIRAYRGRAEIAQRRQSWEKAESDLRKWIELEPEEASAHQRLGQVLFMHEQDAKDQEGFKAFARAQQLNNDLPNPYVSAALMYQRRDSTSRAMEAFERAFQQSGTDATTLVSYGQALLQNGDIQKAEQVLKQARSAAPDQVNVWLLSGVAARMAGDAETAEQHLLRALALQPSNREVLNQLALVLAESPDQDDKQRGLQFASMNRQLNQDNADINVSLAWVLYQNGRVREASQLLQQALTNASLTADGKYLVAEILAASNNPTTKKNAKTLLESALKDNRGIFIERKAAEELLATL
ncbi:tetratricopeptide repeat protein [Botrimarina sp.]|uniref:tetratricopeptide repeat protein n=1 Tax=Botrimarina sp. TaxID=2795802 RepID=UPI0032EDE711